MGSGKEVVLTDGKRKCRRRLKGAGFTLRSVSGAGGRRHPDRGARSRCIAARAAARRGAGQPVTGADSGKRGQAGNLGQAGRQWRPAGDAPSPSPAPPAETPPQATLTSHDTPQNHLNLERCLFDD